MLSTKSKTELLGTYVLQTVNTSTLEVEDKDTSSQCTATLSKKNGHQKHKGTACPVEFAICATPEHKIIPL